MTRMTPSQQQWSKAQAILTYRQPLPWQRGVPPQIPWILGSLGPWGSPIKSAPEWGMERNVSFGWYVKSIGPAAWQLDVAPRCYTGSSTTQAIFGRRISGEPWVSSSVYIIIYIHIHFYIMYTVYIYKMPETNSRIACLDFPHIW